jgi:hypothetical protein
VFDFSFLRLPLISSMICETIAGRAEGSDGRDPITSRSPFDSSTFMPGPYLMPQNEMAQASMLSNDTRLRYACSWKFFERIKESLDDVALFLDSVIWNFKLQNYQEQFRFTHPTDSIFNSLAAFRTLPNGHECVWNVIQESSSIHADQSISPEVIENLLVIPR